MHLFRSDDPRDELAKATRDELWDFAKARGLIPQMLKYMDIFVWTPDHGFVQKRPPGFIASQANVTHEEMAQWLRNIGEVHMKAAVRVMGRAVEPTQFSSPPVQQMLKDSEAMKSNPPTSMSDIRKAVKAAGIVAARTDNKATLLAKLKEHGAHAA